MKRNFHRLPPTVVLAIFAASLFAAEPNDHPVETHLFPPEFLMQHREAIGLTDEQLTESQDKVASLTG